ncbi:MAG: glycoside hydrolase [Clostridiaceae bacterium]|nr:glycoside hydrolase [Clostridiaceae bacterium]
MKRKIPAAFAVVFVSFMLYTNTVFADYQTEHVTLRQGMRSMHVTELQEDLRNLGYFNSNPTGYFGSLTHQAVVDYQKKNYLYMDGIVGRNTARELKVDMLIRTAKSFQGVPYVWGGTSPSGFDCSGFTHYSLLKNDIIIPRTSAAQYNTGLWVEKSNLKPGDLVFFTTYKPGPSHVGIYIGNNQFIHASSGANKVTISDLNKSYYQQRYIGAKRVVN